MKSARLFLVTSLSAVRSHIHDSPLCPKFPASVFLAGSFRDAAAAVNLGGIFTDINFESEREDWASFPPLISALTPFPLLCPSTNSNPNPNPHLWCIFLYLFGSLQVEGSTRLRTWRRRCRAWGTGSSSWKRYTHVSNANKSPPRYLPV